LNLNCCEFIFRNGQQFEVIMCFDQNKILKIFRSRPEVQDKKPSNHACRIGEGEPEPKEGQRRAAGKGRDAPEENR